MCCVSVVAVLIDVQWSCSRHQLFLLDATNRLAFAFTSISCILKSNKRKSYQPLISLGVSLAKLNLHDLIGACFKKSLTFCSGHMCGVLEFCKTLGEECYNGPIDVLLKTP